MAQLEDGDKIIIIGKREFYAMRERCAHQENGIWRKMTFELQKAAKRVAETLTIIVRKALQNCTQSCLYFFYLFLSPEFFFVTLNG